MKNEIEKRVSTSLEVDDKLERFRRLTELKEKMPAETFSVLISWMESPALLETRLLFFLMAGMSIRLTPFDHVGVERTPVNNR